MRYHIPAMMSFCLDFQAVRRKFVTKVVKLSMFVTRLPGFCAVVRSLQYCAVNLQGKTPGQENKKTDLQTT